MDSRSHVSAPLSRSACTCRAEEPCACGAAQDDALTPVREEVTAYFVALRDVVYRDLCYLGCSKEDAEDLTQEAFTWLYRLRAVEGRDLAPEAVRPYILTVARRRGLDRMRRQRFERVFVELSRNVVETLPDEGQETDERELEEQQRRALLIQALQQLSPLQRECLHLRAEGRKLRESSAIVGVPEKRVSEAIQRGIRRLRRVIDGLTR